MRTSPLLLLLLLWLPAACISPGEPDPVRSFRPLVPALDSALEGASAELRLREVVGASHLKQRMAWREDEVEYGFHELRRWAELPEQYVERALVSVLYDGGVFVRSERGGAPTLTVELLAFEELRSSRECLVELAARWESADGVIRQWRVEGRARLHRSSPTEVAKAIGDALGKAVTDLARQLVQPPDPGA